MEYQEGPMQPDETGTRQHLIRAGSSENNRALARHGGVSEKPRVTRDG
jgi:hypothetical protein